MNRLLTILLLLGATAHGQINNPPTSVNIVDSTATGRAVLTATNAAAAATAIGLGTANEVTFNRVQVGGAIITADDFSGGNFAITAGHALTFASGGTPGATLTNLGLGAANNVTFSNITASGTLGVTGNATFSGTANLAPSQTADSGSSLMTRSLSDAQSLQLSVRPHNSSFVSFFGGSTTTATNGAIITQNQLARVSSGNAANNISRLQNRDILPVGLGAGGNAAINFSQNLEFGFTGQFAHNSVANATTRIMFGGTNGYISGTNVARHVGWRADGANNVYATFGDGTNYTEILATNTTQIQKWWHIAANNGSVVWSIDGTQVASTTNGPNSSGGVGSGYWFMVSETIDAAVIYWEVWQLFTRRNL
jgi:hypothetical protein